MALLLVVVPFCEKDYKDTITNLERAIEMDGTSKHHALLHYDTETSQEALDTVQALAERYFAKVRLCRYDVWRGDQAWPHHANNAWQAAARHVEQFLQAGFEPEDPEFTYRGWLWWESDAIPIRKGWLNTLEHVYTRSRKPFMGYVDPERKHLNGVAIYPTNVSTYAEKAFLTREAPFDLVLSQEIGVERNTPKVKVANDLFAHFIKDYGGGESLGVKEHELKRFKTQVIAHGVSILHTARSVPEYSVDGIKVAAQLPFQDQTHYPCGFYHLPTQSNICYFNCGIEEIEGSLYLFARRARFTGLKYPDGQKESFSDIVIFQLDENNYPVRMIVPEPPKRFPQEQWEDPRVIIHNGEVFLSLVTWVHNRPWGIRQSLVKLSKDLSKFEVYTEPIFGNNHSTPQAAIGHEKNWTWFVHDGVFHCAYKTNPMVVFSIDKEGRPNQTYFSEEMKTEWTLGEIRGGTMPVRVGDEYITFFHSSSPWRAPKRRYHMGAIAFSAVAPFHVTRITASPLLSGSERDPRIFGGPPVIFACGALLRNAEWLITFGINDENCGWIKIPHEDLDGKLK